MKNNNNWVNWREIYDREATDYALTLVKEGYYSIDENGYIWRQARLYKGKQIPCPPRRAENKSRGGYFRVALNRPNTKVKSVAAHRLIWEYYNGPIPLGLEINHKDRDRDNNRLDNLELVNHQENIIHSYRNGRLSAMTGLPPLNQEDKFNIFQGYLTGVPLDYLAELYGITASYARYVAYLYQRELAA